MTTNRRESLLWQRWEDIDRLLSAALELPVDQRDAHVRGAAGEDAPLRDLVLRLLDRVHRGRQEELFPDEGVVLAAFSSGGAPRELDVLPPGTVVGRYRIVERIGRGGMATVYEAERADGSYQQRVALKVLRRGLDTDDVIKRFLAERQILSSLSHPNIARLLDGGATESGLPFLVMELAQGEPITRWADNRNLDVRSRLHLFLGVADAVAAAHRQLVVHRDIKPSNVMVGADGRVTLLDFGIAKLLDRDDDITRTGSTALTPEYASPEQLHGGAITTGTDVFQLGLLLRELLTGLPPHATGTDTGDPPLRPSRAALTEFRGTRAPPDRALARSTTPERLARLLRGDLDIMVGKATRPEVADRYPSVDELAADVHRFLSGHPIAAHPESAAYRARKFIQRHPWFLQGTAAATLSLVSFVVTLTMQNIRVGRERDLARAASNRALATQEFLVNLLRTPDPTTSGATTQNPGLTVGEALERGRARIDSDLRSQPEVKSAILVAMGRTYTGLGRWLTADTLLRESYRIMVELHGEGSPPVVPPLLALADNYLVQREHGPADSLYHVAAEILAHGPPDSTIATILEAMSRTRRELGSLDSSLALANRAVTIRRALGDSTSEAYIGSLGALGFALRGAQRLDSAEAIYRLVIRRMEQDSSANRQDLAIHHNNLAYLLRVKGDYAGAEASYRTALAITTEVLGPGHISTLQVRQNLANAIELAGRFDDAIAIAREQIAASEAQWPQGHWRVGSAYMGLGRAMMRYGRPADGVPLIDAGIRSFAQTIGPDHEWTHVARADLGGALVLSGADSRGRPVLMGALSALARRDGRLSPDARSYLGRLATYLEKADHADLVASLRDLLAAKAD